MDGSRLDYVRGKSISIVVPAFNESQFIVDNLREVIRTFANFDCDFEVILVDDGSSDDTHLQAT